MRGKVHWVPASGGAVGKRFLSWSGAQALAAGAARLCPNRSE